MRYKESVPHRGTVAYVTSAIHIHAKASAEPHTDVRQTSEYAVLDDLPFFPGGRPLVQNPTVPPAIIWNPDSMSYPFDRAHYRIQYPMRERPELLMEGKRREVIDCSERGLRFTCPGGPFPEPGTMLHGRVRFRRGMETQIQGTVVRIQDEEVALHLTNSEIPLAIIFGEQRYLRAHYPLWR